MACLEHTSEGASAEIGDDLVVACVLFGVEHEVRVYFLDSAKSRSANQPVPMSTANAATRRAMLLVTSICSSSV